MPVSTCPYVTLQKEIINPIRLKSKLLLLRHLQASRAINEEKIKACRHNQLLEFLLDKNREKFRNNAERRVDQHAKEMMPTIIKRWYDFTVPKYRAKMKYKLICNKRKLYSFVAWKRITHRALSAQKLACIVSRKLCKNVICKLYANLLKSNNQQRLMQLRLIYSHWIYYHCRWQKFIKCIRSASLSFLISFFSAWKRFSITRFNLKLLIRRRRRREKLTIFHKLKLEYHTKKIYRQKFRLRIFKRYIHRSTKVYAIKIWLQLHKCHQGAKKIQTFFRGYNTRKRFNVYAKRLIKLERERYREHSLYINISLAFCDATLKRYEKDMLLQSIDRRMVSKHMNAYIRISRVDFFECGMMLFDLYDILNVNKIEMRPAFFCILYELGILVDQYSKFPLKNTIETDLFGDSIVEVVTKSAFQDWLFKIPKQLRNNFVYRIFRRNEGLMNRWYKYSLRRKYQYLSMIASINDLFENHARKFLGNFSCEYCFKQFTFYRDKLKHKKLHKCILQPWKLSDQNKGLSDKKNLAKDWRINNVLNPSTSRTRSAFSTPFIKLMASRITRYKRNKKPLENSRGSRCIDQILKDIRLPLPVEVVKKKRKEFDSFRITGL